jgi:ACS family glucarate transporter-like MFS transporter
MLSLRVRMIGLLFVLSFINFLLRNNLSAATSVIGDEYALNSTQIGWIIGSFNFSYMLFQIPGGMIGDRFGPRAALLICAVSWGVLTFFTGFAPELFAASTGGAIASLMIVRLLMGVAQAPMFPIAGVVIARWFPAGRWAVPNAVLNTALTLGQAAIGPLFTYLIVKFGWREAFYIVSPSAIVAAVVWWIYARNWPREHPAITQGELDFIEKAAIVDTGLALEVPLRKVLLDRNVLLLAAGSFCSNYVFYIFANWLFEYLVKQRGYTLLESGMLASVPYLTGAVLATIGGIVSDTLSRRMGPTWGCRLPGMLGLVLVAGFLLGGVYSTSPYVALTLLSLCFGFQQFPEGAFWAGATFAAGPNAGTATGVLNTGGNLPGLLAPFVGFLVDQAGWVTAFASGAIFALVGAILWLFVRLPEQARSGPGAEELSAQ